MKSKFTNLLIMGIFCFSILLGSESLFAAIVEPEISAVTREFSGDVGNTTRYSFGAGLTLQQNKYLGYTNRKLGYLVNGIDINYFSINNEFNTMTSIQLGVVGTFYFSSLFPLITKSIIPLVRLHAGAMYASISSTAEGLEDSTGVNPFIGIGTGLRFTLFKKVELNTYYLFDSYVLSGGMIFSHSLNISALYRFNFR